MQSLTLIKFIVSETIAMLIFFCHTEQPGSQLLIYVITKTHIYCASQKGERNRERERERQRVTEITYSCMFPKRIHYQPVHT